MPNKRNGGRKSRHKKRKSRRRKRKSRRRKTRRSKTRRRKRRKRGGVYTNRKFNVLYNNSLSKTIWGGYPNSDTINNLVKKAKTAFNIPANSQAKYGLHEQSLEWTPTVMEPLPPAMDTNKKITENFPDENLILFKLKDDNIVRLRRMGTENRTSRQLVRSPTNADRQRRDNMRQGT